jgi:predicted aconitase with swiveling domain
MILHGRSIRDGEAEGEALCTKEPIGFFGMVDPKTGEVTDPGHELHGRSIAGKVLVFPGGKGSTVGSYVLHSLKWNAAAPLALVMEAAEPIVAAGAILAEIPAVDRVDIASIRTGDRVRVKDGEVSVEAVR